MVSKYLISSNAQKILDYLLLNSGKPCYEREVARGAKVSYGSANKILNDFYKKGLVERKAEGRMNYYNVKLADPYIQEFKILTNILLLEPLVGKLKPYAHKIVVFGSWACGTDREKSDIDLFIVSSDETTVRSIINNYSFSHKVAHRKIQAIIESPASLMKKTDSNKVFMVQVNQGKILWEREINEDNL